MAADPAPARPVVAAVVAAGGALGAAARHTADVLFPVAPDAWPWATLLVNLSGCLLVGLLVGGLEARRRPVHPLLRPFLGTGVLGGYTTFSAYAVQGLLVGQDRPVLAGAYLVITLVGAVAAVLLGLALAGRSGARP